MLLQQLALYCRENHEDYQRALQRAIRGALPSRKIGGRWFIEVQDTVKVADNVKTPEPSA